MLDRVEGARCRVGDYPMSDVWIHHATGVWYVTRDGIELIERTHEVALKNVRFVIDPVGIERARSREKKSTCAWAVGERLSPQYEIVGSRDFHRVEFEPARHDHFQVNGARVSGCAYLYALLGTEGEARTGCVQPEYGDTERRKVQQYGRIR